MENATTTESPGKLYGKLIRLALPIMAGNFVHMLYNLADTYFLGKVGREALAAPSIAFNIIMLLMVFGSSFAMAGTTLIAQARGKRDQEKTDFYLGQMTTLVIGISLILVTLGLIFTHPLLRLLQVPDDIYGHTLIYLRIILLGIPFMFGGFILQSSLQGMGDSFTPFLIQLGTVILNIMLDPLLIFGIGIFPALGVAGAAIATVICRFLASVISFYILISGKRGLRLRLRHMRLQKDSVMLLVKIGMPTAFGQGIATLGFTVMQGVVNLYGTAVIAAFGVGNRIIGLFNMPAMGFSQATASIVGQSLGAKNIKRAKMAVHQSLWTIGIFISVAMTLTFFFGASFVRFFVDDPEVIQHGVMQFRIVSVSVVFFAMFNILNGAFQGGGDTIPVMANNIFRLWGIRVPFLYISTFVLTTGPVGIWWAMFWSNLIVSIIAFILYKTDRWAHKINPDHI